MIIKETKPTFTEKVKVAWASFKGQPKIWGTTLAVLCLSLGFAGGMSLDYFTANGQETGSMNGQNPMSNNQTPPNMQGGTEQGMTPPDMESGQTPPDMQNGSNSDSSESNDDSTNQNEDSSDSDIATEAG